MLVAVPSKLADLMKSKMSTMNLRSTTSRTRKNACCTICSGTTSTVNLRSTTSRKRKNAGCTIHTDTVAVPRKKPADIKPADTRPVPGKKPADIKQADTEPDNKIIRVEPTLILRALLKNKCGKEGQKYWSQNKHQFTVQYEGFSAEIEIVAGDITEETVNAIVNSTAGNLNLQAGGVVSKAILAKGGQIIQAECNLQGSMVDNVAITRAGRLKCDHVIHLHGSKNQACWSDIIKKGLAEADKQIMIDSIAFPILGTGAKQQSTENIAEVMSKTFREYILGHPDNIQLIRIVVFQPKMVEQFKEAFLAEIKGKTKLVEEKDAPSNDIKIDGMLPTHWHGKIGEFEVREVVLSETSQEFKNVYNKFTSTVKNLTKMVSIKRIQNPALYCQFVIKKRMLEKTLGGKCPQVVRELWHGTAAENTDDINRNGFNRNYAGKCHGSRLGKGIYFARDAECSTSSYAKTCSFGLKHVYLAQVLTGEYTSGTPELLAPPPKNALQPSSRYESTVDSERNPEMFAIFNDTQMYPEYLLTFRI